MKRITLIICVLIAVFVLSGCFLGKPKVAVQNPWTSQTVKEGMIASGTSAPTSAKVKVNDAEFEVINLAGGAITDFEKITPEDIVTILSTTVASNGTQYKTNYLPVKLKKGKKYIIEVDLSNGNKSIEPYNKRP